MITMAAILTLADVALAGEVTLRRGKARSPQAAQVELQQCIQNVLKKG